MQKIKISTKDDIKTLQTIDFNQDKNWKIIVDKKLARGLKGLDAQHTLDPKKPALSQEDYQVNFQLNGLEVDESFHLNSFDTDGTPTCNSKISENSPCMYRQSGALHFELNLLLMKVIDAAIDETDQLNDYCDMAIPPDPNNKKRKREEDDQANSKGLKVDFNPYHSDQAPAVVNEPPEGLAGEESEDRSIEEYPDQLDA